MGLGFNKENRHAEMSALRQAGVGDTVFVARIHRDGSTAMAKPCAACEIELRKAGVSRAFFTLYDDLVGWCRLNLVKTRTYNGYNHIVRR